MASKRRKHLNFEYSYGFHNWILIECLPGKRETSERSCEQILLTGNPWKMTCDKDVKSIRMLTSNYNWKILINNIISLCQVEEKYSVCNENI